MPVLIQINGTWGVGKTTTAIQLARFYEYDGLKVANLTFEKWSFDSERYWEGGRDHFVLPLECVKGLNVIEEWLPPGYDVYIVEGRYPFGNRFDEYLIANILPVDKQNLCIPVSDYTPTPRDLAGRELIITKCTPFNVPIDHVAVDTHRILLGVAQLRAVPVNPRLTLPRFNTQVIGIGFFPREFYLVYPNLKWYGPYISDLYLEDLKTGTHSTVLIGHVLNPETIYQILRDDPRPVITYCPGSIGLPDDEIEFSSPPTERDDTYTADILRNHPRGTPLSDTGYIHIFNNRYWVGNVYQNYPSVLKQENRLLCNGWVSPKYLIEDGYLEEFR